MNAKFSLALAAVLLVALPACSLFESAPPVVPTASPMPTVTQFLPPTATPLPPPTSTPIVIMQTPTPQPSNWKLPDPPSASQLPRELSPAIEYIAPPVDCAKANDPNVTCSTIKGQLTDKDFVLKAGQALVMTGDEIGISANGQLLVDRPSYDTVHDLWVVVNSTGQDQNLHMLAPDGSFRGYFKPTDGKWNIQKVTHLRDLHLYLFLLPTQTYDRFTPTPVPNCESKYGCDKVDVRVVVFDDSGQHVAAYGLYLEAQPFWQDLLQLLGQ